MAGNGDGFTLTGFAFPLVTEVVACDYPAATDVRASVVYADGDSSGTLVVPAESVVVLGVGYGAGGTEFTGTLFVPGGLLTDGASSVNFDMGDDWTFIDHLRTVSYFVKLTTSTFDAPLTVPYVLRRATTRQEATTGGMLVPRAAVVFHFWTSILGPLLVPKIADVILEQSGRRWTVALVEEFDEGLRYRLTCTKERP